MNRDSLLAGLQCALVPFEAPGLSCFLRPLDVADNLAVIAHQEKHGKQSAYQMIFARAVRDKEGERLLSDDDATLVANFKSTLVGAVIERITELSRPDSGESGKGHSTEEKT